jgi:hypothetical protein
MWSASVLLARAWLRGGDVRKEGELMRETTTTIERVKQIWMYNQQPKEQTW